MSEKRYNALNNTVGWIVFAIAAATYLLTLEPSASFWDCGEYIAQSYLLEVGHPPGNPFFALTARFFANFASSPEKVAVCVNAMSALLSAATILLLFWTITHLARRLLTGGKGKAVKSNWQAALIMGGGICGALAYTWSDTFWFSAVEAEVYAFSSFCTALTFWLILKWENRCDQPSSDRYLVVIAYVVGLSIGVHLLNLLCVPAIALTVYYRKVRRTRWWMTLPVLLLSFAIIVFILYGMVPGYLRIAQQAELLAVNRLGFSFNTGVAAYTLLFVAIACWTLFELYVRRSAARMKLSFLLLLASSGIFLISDNLYVPAALAVFCAVYLFRAARTPVRVMSNIALYVTVILIGFSSYTIVLLRSSAKVPMNVNAPDNVFSLASYIARDQYGDSPLFYGTVYTTNSELRQRDKNGKDITRIKKRRYEKNIKSTPGEKDRYVEIAPVREFVYAPEMYMFMPRIYNPASAANYKSWTGGIEERETVLDVKDGDKTRKVKAKLPSYWDNIKFFAVYQVHHMYWRYLLWNFVGRQNDIAGNGEVTQGNWISGIPLIDDIRLGDQDLLPEEFGEGNAGHNVYYGIPLLLGILGLIWQARQNREGKRQCWVVFLLFFMTGLAIVVYLNQIPGQARERDYSFAGSFYAYAIWMGLGAIAAGRLLQKAVLRLFKKADRRKAARAAAIATLAVGVAVPLQMVSQTWDDHDRSGRYFCRDYAHNVLSSVGDNAILFVSGDNISFPVWYIQDTEGFRTDVRALNTDYMSSPWYLAQITYPYFNAPRIEMMAEEGTFAHRKRRVATVADNPKGCDAETALRDFYSPAAIERRGGAIFNHPAVRIAVDRDKLLRGGTVTEEYASLAADTIHADLLTSYSDKKNDKINESRVAMVDILASNSWRRPVCYVKCMAKDNYSFVHPYMAQTGLTIEVTPFRQDSYTSVGAGYSDRAYRNFTERFRWGGLDKNGQNIYLDEANRDMVTYTRLAMLDLAERLITEGVVAEKAAKSPETYPLLPLSAKTATFAADRFAKARDILLLKEEKLPESAAKSNYEFCLQTADLLYRIGEHTGNAADKAKADSVIEAAIDRFARHIVYFQTLTYWQPISNSDRLLYSNGGFLRLLSTYADGNPEAAMKKIKEIEHQGVDVWAALRRTLNAANGLDMPAQPDNRLFENLRGGYLTLKAYNPGKTRRLLGENPKYKETAEKAVAYHDKFEKIKQRNLENPAH